MSIEFSVIFSLIVVMVLVINYSIVRQMREDLHSLFGLFFCSILFSYFSVSIFAFLNWPTTDIEVFPKVVSDRVVVVDVGGEAHNILKNTLIRFEDVSEKKPIIARVADEKFGFFFSEFKPGFKLKEEK